MRKPSVDGMKSILAAALADRRLKPDYNEEFEQYLALLPVRDGVEKVALSLSMDRENETVVSTVFRDNPINEDTLPAVVEFVIRVNFGLSFGCFDIDLDTGMLQFRTSVCFRDAEPNRAMLDVAIQDAIDSFYYFYPALLSVEDGREEAFAAYDKVWS